MMNRFVSAKNVSSRAGSLCAGSFCADKNNAMLLDNAIALSIFICLIIIAIILIPASIRNPLNCFLKLCSPQNGQTQFIE